MERNDLTFHNNMWDIMKIQQALRQGLLECATHAWDAAHKGAAKDITYNDMLGTVMNMGRERASLPPR